MEEISVAESTWGINKTFRLIDSYFEALRSRPANERKADWLRHLIMPEQRMTFWEIVALYACLWLKIADNDCHGKNQCGSSAAVAVGEGNE